MDEAYLVFIRSIKDEELKIVPAVPEKTEMGCDVEKAYHKDMPRTDQGYPYGLQRYLSYESPNRITAGTNEI